MHRLIITALLILALSASLQAQNEERLVAAVKDYFKISANGKTPSFRHAFTDLDGDGLADAIVLMREADSCGSGGCNMLVFHGTRTGFTFVSSSTITNEPIRVSPEKNSGWNALIVHTNGVGDVVMRFNGMRYPLNPSTQQKAASAQLSTAQTVLKQSVPPNAWTYTEEARYQSRQEPHGIVLKDGRTVIVQYVDTGLTSDEVDKWPRGKRVLIAYESGYGTALLDPENGVFASILLMPREHPIERMTTKCLEINQSTAGMVDCYRQELSRWDQELNRFYGQLMSSLDAEAKQAVQTAQREWIKYRDAQRLAIGAIYTEGTISQISRAIEINALTKEQAEKLAGFLAR